MLRNSKPISNPINPGLKEQAQIQAAQTGTKPRTQSRQKAPGTRPPPSIATVPIRRLALLLVVHAVVLIVRLLVWRAVGSLLVLWLRGRAVVVVCCTASVLWAATVLLWVGWAGVVVDLGWLLGVLGRHSVWVLYAGG